MTLTIGKYMIHIGHSQDIRIHAHALELYSACDAFYNDLRAIWKYGDNKKQGRGDTAKDIGNLWNDGGPGETMYKCE